MNDKIIRKLLLDELALSSDDPHYMAEYMRVKRKVEALEAERKHEVDREVKQFKARIFRLIL